MHIHVLMWDALLVATKDWGDDLSWHGGISECVCVCFFAGRFGGSRKGGGKLIEQHNCTGYQVEHLCLVQSLPTASEHDGNLISTIQQQLSLLVFLCFISALCSEICPVCIELSPPPVWGKWKISGVASSKIVRYFGYPKSMVPVHLLSQFLWAFPPASWSDIFLANFFSLFFWFAYAYVLSALLALF
jgi:hypothetical protein